MTFWQRAITSGYCRLAAWRAGRRRKPTGRAALRAVPGLATRWVAARTMAVRAFTQGDGRGIIGKVFNLNL